MFDPSLRRAPGSDVDRHLAHGKLQPVLHPAVTLAVIALIYFAAEPINRLLGKGGLSVDFPGDGMILSSIAVTNGIVAIKLVFGLG